MLLHTQFQITQGKHSSQLVFKSKILCQLYIARFQQTVTPISTFLAIPSCSQGYPFYCQVMKVTPQDVLISNFMSCGGICLISHSETSVSIPEADANLWKGKVPKKPAALHLNNQG